MSREPVGDYFSRPVLDSENRASLAPRRFDKRGPVSPHAHLLSQYLRARRAQLRPEDVGFPHDPHRRVCGLRREEVAELAGISAEYYTRLEQGRSSNISQSVLASLTRALRLDSDAIEYFYRLVLPEPPTTSSRDAPAISALVLNLVEEWSDVPVYLYDRNQDILLSNDLARALLPQVVPGSNSVIAIFAMPDDIRGTAEWKTLARAVVAALRYHGEPSDLRLQEIVGGLSVRDPLFRALWAGYDTAPLTSGEVPVFVEGFGRGNFPWQNFNLPGGLFMGVWLAPPGSFAATVIAHLRLTLRGELEQGRAAS
jgi:transcriptional regulator with XRE-family HTH domain